MKIEVIAGRPYGHVPGHSYLDVEIEAACNVATLIVTSGSAQGHDEEHNREEYTRRATNLADAIEAVRDAALGEQSQEETRRYIEAAASRALRQLLVDA